MLKKLPLISLLVCSLLACDSATEEVNQPSNAEKKQGQSSIKMPEISGTINDSLDSIKAELKKLQPHADRYGEQAADEVEKLYTFEYTVKSFALDLGELELESELKKLGEDRWDCFEVVPVNNSLKVFCKKLPKTYLRYIPRLF